jgi:CIC family chloride channel protein
MLLLLLAGKMILTLFAIGLGVPGGIIGPIFGMGVVLGTILAIVPAVLVDNTSNSGTYAVLGMAGLMAATLHAPLAALVAVMELAANQQIVLPAMLVIVTAYVTTVQFFNNKSIFMTQLDFMQLPYKLSPADDVLQKVGVLAVLSQEYQLLVNPDDTTVHRELTTLTPPQQLLIKRNDDNSVQFYTAQYDVSLSLSGDSSIQYAQVTGLSHQATMAEVLHQLEDRREGLVYIYQQDPAEPIGIIRWDQLRALLIKQNNLI